VIVLVVQMFFSKWGEEGEVDLKVELEQLIVNTASRCLLGEEIRNSHLEKLTSLFHDLDNGMLPISVMFPYLPIPAHNRRDRLVITVFDCPVFCHWFILGAWT
jgi:sterol 14-demethylase